MSNIAIVGTSGSGKTVLTCVLASRFEKAGNGMPWFNPLGRTLKNVSDIWHELELGKWPQSTTAGQALDLQWQLEFPSGRSAQIVVRDCAGQDIKRIFSGETIPPGLQPLNDWLTSADIVLFILNLGNFIGEGDHGEKTDNTLALKLAMDRLRQRNRPCAVVLTQADQYIGLAAERNSAPPPIIVARLELPQFNQMLLQRHAGWVDLVREHLPSVHGAHLRDGGVALLPVAAVKDTEVQLLPNAKSRRVPKPQFKSEGLEDLLFWLEAAVAATPPSSLPSPNQLPLPPGSRVRRYRVVGGDGKEYGPLEAATVREWIAEGRLNAKSQVTIEESGGQDSNAGQLGQETGSPPQIELVAPSLPSRRGPTRDWGPSR